MATPLAFGVDSASYAAPIFFFFLQTQSIMLTNHCSPTIQYRYLRVSFAQPQHTYHAKVQIHDVDLHVVVSDKTGPAANCHLTHVHGRAVFNLLWFACLTRG